MTGLRAQRSVIVLGYLALGLGVGLYFFGPFAIIPLPLLMAFGAAPAFNWIRGVNPEADRRLRADITRVGPDALTSEQMDEIFKRRAPTVIDDDPAWGKLVEGTETIWNRALVAVQVTNSTAEPDGTFKKVWLRVPARGDRQGLRVCIRAACGRDISWPPRTAREAVAWTFRLCVDHYRPAKAS
jgi:hypothetical protein